MIKTILLLIVFTLLTTLSAQQLPAPTGIHVPVFADPILAIDFDTHLRDWDGFGVNYVETAQTRDYDEWPQEYGSFSLLNDQQRKEIMQLIFGEDGLKPAMTKLFLDCWHEPVTARTTPVYPSKAFVVNYAIEKPIIDGKLEQIWHQQKFYPIENVTQGVLNSVSTASPFTNQMMNGPR